MSRILAAADIGSNTVHLLVGRTDGVFVERIVNESEWMGLGEIVAAHGEIPSQARAALVETLRQFLAISSQFKAKQMYTFATEAMRRATNHNAVLTKIRKDLGIEVDLISGVREAELALRGALLDARSSAGALMDVGGGSAQVARFLDGKVLEEASLPIGSGALRAAHRLTDPPTRRQVDRVIADVTDHIESNVQFKRVRHAVASGGVARGVMRALHPDGERQVDYYELEYLVEALSYLPVETAAARFRVGPKRAASLLPGAIVLLRLLSHFGLDCVTVSEGSIREGAILEMEAGGIKGCKL